MVEHLSYKQGVIGSSPFALKNELVYISAQLNGRVTVSKTVGMGSTPFALVWLCLTGYVNNKQIMQVL